VSYLDFVSVLIRLARLPDMKRALRIAGWIYPAGAILMALILVPFHNWLLGTEHLGLQHLVIVVVVLVLGLPGIINISEQGCLSGGLLLADGAKRGWNRIEQAARNKKCPNSPLRVSESKRPHLRGPAGRNLVRDEIRLLRRSYIRIFRWARGFRKSTVFPYRNPRCPDLPERVP
jgi:hypothetical protein